MEIALQGQQPNTPLLEFWGSRRLGTEQNLGNIRCHERLTLLWIRIQWQRNELKAPVLLRYLLFTGQLPFTFITGRWRGVFFCTLIWILSWKTLLKRLNYWHRYI